MRRWFFAALTLAIVASPTSVEAQDTGITPEQLGRIVLQLVDANTGAPISGALVTMTTLNRRLVSDSTGQVLFADLPPGAHQLEVQHIAYGVQVVDVEVQGMQTALTAVPLTQEAVAVAPIDVMVEYRPRYLEEEGFYNRRIVGQGTFFDPAFVERWNEGATRADRFVDLLIDMSPPMGSAMGRARGPNAPGSIMCPSGEPEIYIDGEPVFDDDLDPRGRGTELEMLPMYSVGAVEVYSGSHGVPDFALEPGVGCGSVVIWTNRWRGRTREMGGAEVELCEPSDPDAIVIEGTIRDEFTGVLLPGAHVLATTYPSGRPRDAETEDITSTADARYRVCDVPADHTVSLKVSTADEESPEYQVALASDLVERDLTIRVAGPGVIAGRILDRDTGEPVAAADISVVGQTRATQTDEDGFFRLEDVLPGDHMLEISHLSFDTMHEVVSIVADRVVDVQAQMSADPIELEPIVVTAIRDRRLELRGFYERRIWGERSSLGHYLDDEDVRRLSPALTTSLMRGIPGIEVRCQGSRDCRVVPRRATSGCTQMNVYINGSLALGEMRRDPVSLDELVLPSEIAGLEVYSGGSSTPAEFTGTTGRCGAIAIWTR